MPNPNQSANNTSEFPPIPNKLYFDIAEASNLSGIKPYILRFWEKEFPQLKPEKRSGNRRFYQIKEILLIRKISDLLYNQGYTIEGARAKLAKTSENTDNEALQKIAQELEIIIAELKVIGA